MTNLFSGDEQTVSVRNNTFCPKNSHDKHVLTVFVQNESKILIRNLYDYVTKCDYNNKDNS